MLSEMWTLYHLLAKWDTQGHSPETVLQLCRDAIWTSIGKQVRLCGVTCPHALEYARQQIENPPVEPKYEEPILDVPPLLYDEPQQELTL
jgi:hypothetical protein